MLGIMSLVPDLPSFLYVLQYRIEFQEPICAGTMAIMLLSWALSMFFGLNEVSTTL